MKKLLSVFFVLLIVLSLTGCGSDKTIKTEDGTVKIDDDQIEVTTEDGKSTTTVGGEGEVSLPDGYPEDVVPIIDGGKVNASSKFEDANKKITYSIMIFTEMDIKDVANYYKDTLKDLKELQIIETPEAITITGQKDGYIIFVFLGVDNSEDVTRTGVNISLTPM